MTIEECFTKIEEFENKIKNNKHEVYYIDSSYCGTFKLYHWVEYGYVWRYEINHKSCCDFSVGVLLEFDGRVFSLEELYTTKEEAKQALDNIEKIGE